jgi:hypothetical protein
MMIVPPTEQNARTEGLFHAERFGRQRFASHKGAYYVDIYTLDYSQVREGQSKSEIPALLGEPPLVYRTYERHRTGPIQPAWALGVTDMHSCTGAQGISQ